MFELYDYCICNFNSVLYRNRSLPLHHGDLLTYSNERLVISYPAELTVLFSIEGHCTTRHTHLNCIVKLFRDVWRQKNIKIKKKNLSKRFKIVRATYANIIRLPPLITQGSVHPGFGLWSSVSGNRNRKKRRQSSRGIDVNNTGIH